MNLCFGFSGAEQSRDLADALVNLLAHGFDVGPSLAGAGLGLFAWLSIAASHVAQTGYSMVVRNG